MYFKVEFLKAPVQILDNDYTADLSKKHIETAA
jgi:hypothetical protein